MEIRHLQHFIALAEEGKFTAAAQRMNIVQSGLSMSIKELEQELGSQLVTRTTRKVSLTAAGELFLEHARGCLALLNDGVQSVRSQDGVVRGRLHLGILQSLTPYVQLATLLQRFHSSYPEVEFAVRALSTEAVPALVRSGYVDLSFQAILGKERWPGVQVIPYAQDSLVAICSSKHPLTRKSSVQLEVLSHESFVDLTPERALRKLVDQIFTQHHLPRSSVYQVSDIETQLYFVAHGLGVAIVPSALARSSTASHDLHTLRILSQAPKLAKWRIAILTRPRRNDIPGKTTVELFLETLAELSRKTKITGET
ncbi:LysR family transcriptional regulator [Granulicella mallensis]|uniref:Transcriptional regulator, LysR family n=1 Tax=Granulicella mallensis (strain ATCC BAA-1857 / DSM 23137 / MP5ACTX8) TaxID=682795 RepID=G8NWJ4_GRAMM|nr:LysR family transcriptional regulator [Granulicella mallensis]AEU37797.1 transcriptional regulator, LysR family [Granulicella mallensis MP5ACTX8]